MTSRAGARVTWPGPPRPRLPLLLPPSPERSVRPPQLLGAFEDARRLGRVGSRRRAARGPEPEPERPRSSSPAWRPERRAEGPRKLERRSRPCPRPER